MSRIGSLPVSIPEGVSVSVDGNNLKIKGSKGELEKKLSERVEVKVKDSEVSVLAKGEKLLAKPHVGTFRSHIVNMILGVTQGWSKVLELVGVGYRAEVTGKDLSLAIGFSHPVLIKAPEGINFKVEKTLITVSGIDKELVGQLADEIRRVRPPEPYKGKGIKYQYEYIRRKAGKAAKVQGAAA